MQKGKEMMEQAREKVTSWGIPFMEGEAVVEGVVWYQENRGEKLRNQCKLKLRVELPEYSYAGSDGAYQLENLWEVEMGEFLRIIDEENIAIDNYVELHEHMYPKVQMYEGKRVLILYHYADEIRQEEGGYLTVFVHIPELYVAPAKVGGKEFQGTYAMTYAYVPIRRSQEI